MLAQTPTVARGPSRTSEQERELDAYNSAFEELELDWHWDEGVLRELSGIDGEAARIAAWLRRHRPHLLDLYDARALAGEILAIKARLQAHSPRMGPR